MSNNSLSPLSGHILLVEDDLVNQMIIKKLFELLGVTVQVASTGKVALDMLTDSNTHFDAVFMDIGLPDINGLEVTRQALALNPFLQNVPIIALTGHVTDKDKDACFASGMRGFISKPTTREILHQELSKFLKT
jgi:CheY-like chemotaxis protein